MSCYIVGAANARAPEVQSDTVPIPQIPGVPQEQQTSFVLTQPSRLSRLHIESNVIGGNYVSGRNIGHGKPGAGRISS